MKTTNRLFLSAIILLCLATSVALRAQGPAHGRGQDGGPGGGDFQDAIHKLFANHDKLKRTVEMTDTGYKSRTVSDDPEIARTLQKHVKEMRERLGAGMMIRRWDPAFAELVEHYKEINHEFKEVEGGVEMVATGKTPDAIKVAQNHARIVSGFVAKGSEQMHKTHPRALGDGKNAEAAAAECPDCQKKEKAKSEAACPHCQNKLKPEPAPAR